MTESELSEVTETVDHGDDDVWEPAHTLREKCGGISKMTEHRWSKSMPDFPKPIYVNGRKFYRRRDRLLFMKRRQAESEVA